MTHTQFIIQKRRLRGRGITLSRSLVTDEYRVNFVGGTEQTAYYTDWSDDAVNTGDAMAETEEENSARMRLRPLMPALDGRD